MRLESADIQLVVGPAAVGPATRPSSELRTRTARSRMRGVTLIELLVVIVIIAIFAAMAIPGIVRSNDDRRAFEKANEIAQLIQEARGRALATGSAQMVAMYANGATVRGTFRHYEGVYNKQPTASCLTSQQWGGNADTNSVMNVVPSTAPPATGPGAVMMGGTNLQYSSNSTLQVRFFLNGNPVTATNYQYLCFSPGGRVYYFADQGVTGVPLSGAFEVRVARYPNGTTVEGITRSVMIDGTDIARIRSF